MLSRLRKSLKSEKGFTLVELMVVVVIIGILVAIVLPQFMKQTDRARTSRAQAELQAMKTLIETWAMDDKNGKAKYPYTQAQLQAALNAGGIQWTNLSDPWGNAYSYYVDTSGKKKFILASNGPDGNAGTNDDIFVTESSAPSVGTYVTTGYTSYDSLPPQ
ncbi:type II secretion system protein G (GspG) [Thermanaeromonas toyohensis ToBE]|uniref:Type II secretion system protein G (GspG) n=1 Tax=Thermanaeromonas toyohensis ToBE TaxID=698762 RepID=A0A1W1VZR9_9FIRM|nr:type II secretion system protein GspG [Thermanaeromonas toyohensis]SMB98621.1 type II secretion system protein G (GspG) [Thermanaeromonas toyohensis ToBE]